MIKSIVLLASVASIATAIHPQVLGARNAPTTTPPASTTATVTGAFTVPGTADACTASAIPYKTSVIVKGGNQDMVVWSNDLGWFKKDNAKWTFSTDTEGVYFLNPQYVGGNPRSYGSKPALFPRTQYNSFSMNMSELTAPYNGQFFFEVGHVNKSIKAPSKSPSKSAIKPTSTPTSNSNSKRDAKSTTKPTGTPTSRLASKPTIDVKMWNATFLNDTSQAVPEDVYWTLHIEGATLCDFPVGEKSCANNEIELTQDSWNAYGVDKWFGDWYKNNSAKFGDNNGMMEVFRSQFNTANSICTLQDRCDLLNHCSELTMGDQTLAGRVYLIWISMQNLSDLFHNMYDALQISEEGSLAQIGTMALDFHSVHEQKIPAPAEPPASQAAGIFGILSSVAGLVGFVPQLKGVAEIAGGIFDVAEKISEMTEKQDTDKSVYVLPDAQYATNAATASSYLDRYVKQLRSTLQKSYDDLLTDGNGIIEIFRGAAWVDRKALRLDNGTAIASGQAWMEQYMQLKLINSIYKQQNAFITWTPYGKVAQVDKDYATTFAYEDCLKFNPGSLLAICYPPNETDILWGPLEGPGMAMLTHYDPDDPKNQKTHSLLNSLAPLGHVELGQPLGGADFHGGDGAPTWNMPNGDSYTFNANDVVTSSLNAFLAGGFNFEATTNSSLQDAANIQPSSAGMFNLPLCVVRDLNKLPSVYEQNGREGRMNYCVCHDFKDWKGNKFQDSVTDPLKLLTTVTQTEDGSNPKCDPQTPGGKVPDQMGPQGQ